MNAKKRRRSRADTSEELLRAVGRLIVRDGFRAVGVNAVAQEAGVDKVLIYRYFGDLDGLLRAFASGGTFWPTSAELLAPEPGSESHTSAAAVSKQILSRLGAALRERPITQAILVAELGQRNPLSDLLDEAREQMGRDLLAPLAGEEDFDVAATATLLAAGITYLVLRAKTTEAYNGIGIRTDAGWQRLEAATAAIIDALYAKPSRDQRS